MEEKQTGKTYTVIQLKLVYQRILEALEDKRKRDTVIAVRTCETSIDAIDEILKIEAAYESEKDKWGKILRIDEINQQDKELFDRMKELFNGSPNNFISNPFNGREKK